MQSKANSLLILAGSGTYPACLATGARRAGVQRISMLALRGMTERATLRLADDYTWFGVGEIGAIRDWVAIHHSSSWGVMAGQITPVALFRTRFDEVARAWLKELAVKNAHTIYGRLVEELEKTGLQIIPASCYMDDYVPGVGVLTQRVPDEQETSDIELGHKIAVEIGHLDIGQTILVKGGMVLAVEAFEGTNLAIKRGGKLGGKGAVVVKAAKPGHDMRFDIPVIGARTLRYLKRAGISVLTYQANRIVMLDKERVIATANKYGIAIVGVDSGLPAVPLRP